MVMRDDLLCFYDSVGRFHEGLVLVMLGGKWGFVNTEGVLVIPCIYDDVWSFQDGLAMVYIKKGRKTGYIDKDNNWYDKLPISM